MICLDIQLEILFQPVFTQESKHGGGIKIILMLGRLFWLRLNIEISVVAFRTRILHRHLHQPCHVVQLQCHIGIQKRFITLSAAPEHVTFSAQFYGSVNGIFNLKRRAGKRIRKRRGSGAVHIAWIAEVVGGAPQQFDSGFIHQRFDIIGHFLKIRLKFS